MLFAYRVTAGQESIVGDLLAERIRKTKAPINAIIVSSRLKGYLIAESQDEVAAKKLVTNVAHVKSILNKTIAFEEIKEMLESKPQEVSLAKGDLIEITSGPFKGEKAKVVRMDLEKEELTVELIEVAVPIPVTIKLNTVKVLTPSQR